MQIRRDYSVRSLECNQKAGLGAMTVGSAQLRV